jgi:hypothetical protein
MKNKYIPKFKRDSDNGIATHPAFSDQPVGKTKKLMGVPKFQASTDARAGSGTMRGFEGTKSDAATVPHSKDSLRGSSQRIYRTVPKPLKK